MMDDTSGFYKRDPGGILLFGRYFVLNANYHLKRDDHASYDYPVDGWSWYDSEDEAREALGFPSKLEEAFNAMTDDEKRRLLGLEA
jgi:hypothetical protein